MTNEQKIERYGNEQKIERLKKEIEILEMANDILETANCKMRDTLNLYNIDEEIWEVK